MSFIYVVVSQCEERWGVESQAEAAFSSEEAAHLYAEELRSQGHYDSVNVNYLRVQ